VAQKFGTIIFKIISLSESGETQASNATDQWRDQWRRRLECVVQQQGGHIEHLM